MRARGPGRQFGRRAGRRGQRDDAFGGGLTSRTTRSASCSRTVVYVVVRRHPPSDRCVDPSWIVRIRTIASVAVAYDKYPANVQEDNRSGRNETLARMRALLIQHDHLSRPGFVGLRLVERGTPRGLHQVVPEDRLHFPAVDTEFPDPRDFDVVGGPGGGLVGLRLEPLRLLGGARARAAARRTRGSGPGPRRLLRRPVAGRGARRVGRGPRGARDRLDDVETDDGSCPPAVVRVAQRPLGVARRGRPRSPAPRRLVPGLRRRPKSRRPVPSRAGRADPARLGRPPAATRTGVAVGDDSGRSCSARHPDRNTLDNRPRAHRMVDAFLARVRVGLMGWVEGLKSKGARIPAGGRPVRLGGDGGDHPRRTKARYGVTVSSFASLSLNPLLVTVSVNRTSPLIGYVRSRRAFAVSVLASGQQQVAGYFARSGRVSGPDGFPDLWQRAHNRPACRWWRAASAGSTANWRTYSRAVTTRSWSAWVRGRRRPGRRTAGLLVRRLSGVAGRQAGARRWLDAADGLSVALQSARRRGDRDARCAARHRARPRRAGRHSTARPNTGSDWTC